MKSQCAMAALLLYLVSLIPIATKALVVREWVLVDQNGHGNFNTIMEAVAAAPNDTDISNGYFVIHVSGGVYNERVSIGYHKRCIMMTGEGKGITVITGNLSVADGLKTSDTPSFNVEGDHFVAINMTFRNTAGPARGQALAVQNVANMSAFYKCTFEGYQDTLYALSGSQFYRDCDVYGTVDMIFGYAAAVFQHCNIFARLPVLGQSDVITAHGRDDPHNNTGFSFLDCKIRAASDLGSTKTYLGRPWRQYSRTVYMQCFMDALVDPEGWLAWDENTNTSIVYYGEYNNTGPGSILDRRVRWLGFHKMSLDDANNFLVSNFISGDSWLPVTGIPYDKGL